MMVAFLPMSTDKHQLKVAIAFGMLYVLWGATYLAMRVAVEPIPPYVLGPTRYLIAGPLMLADCAVSGRKLSNTREDTPRLRATGVLRHSVANIGATWTEV